MTFDPTVSTIFSFFVSPPAVLFGLLSWSHYSFLYYGFIFRRDLWFYQLESLGGLIMTSNHRRPLFQSTYYVKENQTGNINDAMGLFANRRFTCQKLVLLHLVHIYLFACWRFSSMIKRSFSLYRNSSSKLYFTFIRSVLILKNISRTQRSSNDLKLPEIREIPCRHVQHGSKFKQL